MPKQSNEPKPRVYETDKQAVDSELADQLLYRVTVKGKAGNKVIAAKSNKAAIIAFAESMGVSATRLTDRDKLAALKGKAEETKDGAAVPQA